MYKYFEFAVNGSGYELICSSHHHRRYIKFLIPFPDVAPAHDKKITTDAVGTAYHAEESNPVPEKTEEQPWQMILRHPRLGVYAMLINIGPLLFGYDMVIIGAVSALPQFKYVSWCSVSF